jgi:hypothetical protein
VITLLLSLQAAPVVLESDRKAYAEYRQCILSKARDAGSARELTTILKHADKGPCKNLRLAAALEMSADDLEKMATAIDAGNPEPIYASVDDRLATMDHELADEAAATKVSEPSNAPD